MPLNCIQKFELELLCPYKGGPQAAVWKIGRKAAIEGEPITDNPYLHRRAKGFFQAWKAGYESWSLRPQSATV